MRLRDKLKQEHPEAVSDEYSGGCCGCPADYGYSDSMRFECRRPIDCRSCWDAEYKEKEYRQ